MLIKPISTANLCFVHSVKDLLLFEKIHIKNPPNINKAR